ncbi:hypothetical protein [Lacinutrix jangbogonensis]|uniref:hypothetical protein n=1 Tax=Lacinutrix jangbogonensis TaxID=1469557 RepID=UPI00053F0053|nr:hypothetical protein [Lacinutrix jangbogonensis]
MENIQYLGNSISECSTINFNSSNNHSISFDVRLQVEDTPNGFVFTNGVLEIAYWTGSAQERNIRT